MYMELIKQINLSRIEEIKMKASAYQITKSDVYPEYDDPFQDSDKNIHIRPLLKQGDAE